LCGLLHDAVYISDQASLLQRIWKETGSRDNVISIATRLWEGRSEFRNPVRGKIFELQNVQPGSEALPARYSVGN